MTACSTEDARYLLPPSAYTSADWFEQEQAGLFGSRWVLVASADELNQPGDYVTACIGRAPVVVLRGEGGALRAFHNVCRHRGMVMLQGTGNAGHTVNCFYHQWRYALDGALQVVPQRKEQFADLVPDDWGLLPAAVEVWEGMVFVHPDPAASPLSDALGGVPAHIGSHQPGLLRQVATSQIEARCNWKLFVENHVDVYHLWYLHADTLSDYDHTRFEHQQLGPHWVSYEPLKHGDLDAAALTQGTTGITHLADRDRFGLGAHLLFPNLMMASAAGFFATYMAVPLAPDRTMIDIRVRAEPDADATAALEAVQSFIQEDVEACQGVQSAVASPSFAIGPLARDHEQPITAFHRHVLAAVRPDGDPS